MFSIILVQQKTTTRSSLFMVRSIIFKCLQLTGWRIFGCRSRRCETSTLPNFVVHFLITSCQVICWPPSGFFHFVGGTENRAREGRWKFIRGTWRNQRSLLSSFRCDRIFSEPTLITRFLTCKLLVQVAQCYASDTTPTSMIKTSERWISSIPKSMSCNHLEDLSGLRSSTHNISTLLKYRSDASSVLV